MGMILLFAVLTKKQFVQKLQHISLPPLCAYPQYIKYVYALTWCVRADAYNLIIIFAS